MAAADDAFTGARSGRLGQVTLRLLDDRGEGRGLGDGELGQDLAVDLDPRRGEAEINRL